MRIAYFCGMSAKLEAHYENRTYYFFVTSQDANELRITMYSTPYTFIRKDDEWINHSVNQMQMVQPLINAVIEAAGIQVS